MKRVTITSNDHSTIYTYTGSDNELKIDESSEYFTVHYNGYSTSYRKGRYNIRVEYLEDDEDEECPEDCTDCEGCDEYDE